MLRITHAVCLGAIILVGTSGCVYPAKRTREHVAAFRQLVPADRRLVLRGRVRVGLDREAVLIAWGAPDQKMDGGEAVDGKETANVEVWTYLRQMTTHAAIGSYDQWQPGNRLTSPGTPLFFSPGDGFGGSGYEGWLLGRPRVQYTDGFVRRAAFVNGKLARYETWYGEFSPLP